MFCNKCGNKMDDGAAFCEKCGNTISTDESTNQTHENVTTKSNNEKQAARYVTTETKKKSDAIRNIAIAAAVLIVVIGGFFAWQVTIGKKSDSGNVGGESTSSLVDKWQTDDGGAAPGDFSDKMELLKDETGILNQEDANKVEEMAATDSMEVIGRNRVLRVLTEGINAPFEFGKDAEFQGLGADVGEAIAKNIGYPLKWVKSKGVEYLFELLKEGTDVDMIISSVANDTRMTADFDFSNPYYETGDVIAHLSTEFVITDLASLSGKKVGVVAGRPADVFMTSQTTAKNVATLKYSSIDEALYFLNLKEIDAVVGDEILLNHSIVESFPNINIINTIINKYSYAVAVRKGDAKLLTKINETISIMKNSGELAQLEAKWVGDVKERAQARASSGSEEEELKKSPKTISVVINKQSGNWSMERLGGFRFVLQGANNTYQSTPIETDGVSRGTCQFTQPVPPGDYTMNVSILGLTARVLVPEHAQSSLAMTVNIGSTITIIYK